MQKPLITIIVPIYNSADTIEKCVNSIQAQTVSNWELIIADNASIDNSLQLCQQLSSKDTRIKVISVPNKGVSNARNAALEISKGEFVCFIDSDDTVDSDYLEQLSSNHDADLSVCGYYIDSIDTTGKIQSTSQCVPNSVFWNVDIQKNCLVDIFEHGYIHLCCNKLLRLSIIQENNIRFKSVPVNEDFMFVMDYLQYATSINVIDKPLYHWIREIGKCTGVNSIPENIIEIYNESQMQTRNFFQNNAIADKIAYMSYELIVYKFYQAYNEGRIQKRQMYDWLAILHDNELVKSAYRAYTPISRGDKVLYLLAKLGWFKLHYLLTQKLLKI